MKTILNAVCLFAIVASTSLAATPLRWTFEASRPVQQTWEIYHGESVSLEPTILEDGTPASYPTNAIATLYYQTNNMGSVWYEAPASIISNSVVAAWTPSLDCGASTYRFFISVVAPGGSISYRANGKLSMMDSPGAVPNALELPVEVIDFSTIDLRNAPWAEASDVEEIGQSIITLSNRVESIVANGGGIVEESDPHALPIALQALVSATNAQASIASKVPITRTVNGKPLSTNITLSASDVGSVPIDPVDGWAKSEQGYRAGSSMMGFGYLTHNSLTLHSIMGDLKFDEDGISQDDVFSVCWPTATDGSPIATKSDIATALGDTVTIAHTALQPSWADTGTVARSISSSRLSVSDGTELRINAGAASISQVLVDNNIYVVETGGDDYNGPEASTTFEPTGPTSWGPITFIDNDFWQYEETYGTAWTGGSAGANNLPITLYAESESAHGWFTIARLPAITNSAVIATSDDIAPLANTNWVNSIKGVFRDIATNVTYGLVVSNGHWLVKEIQ